MIKGLFLLSIILSIISQMRFLEESSLKDYLKMIWVPLFVILLITKLKDFKNKPILLFLFFLLIFFSYCFLAETFSWRPYLKIGGDTYNIAISFIVFACSYVVWKNYGSQFLLKAISICLICLSGFICYDAILNTSLIAALSGTMYAKELAKNSLAQILLAIIVICGLTYIPKNSTIKVIYLGLIGLVVITIFMLRSRATLAGLLFVIGYVILKYKNKNVRIALGIITLIAICFIFIDEETYDTVINGIFLARRDTNLNDISSGRVGLIEEALRLFSQSPWIGIGKFYIDCMPVCVLTQYGIIGTLIYFTFIGYMGVKVYPLRNDKLGLIAGLLFGAYLINSLFEAYPPFGPGIKCFLLWMMMGFAFAQNRGNVSFKGSKGVVL